MHDAPLSGTRYSYHAVFILLLWLGIVIFASFHHEMWCDEVRAYSIAIDAPGFISLPDILKNEGHPALWYYILRLGHVLYPDPVILKIISVAVAFFAVALFLFRAPFPIWMKLLFSFSVLPMYEYSVTVRNYGISMLLLFGIADRFERDERNYLSVAVLLALLANSNAHSCILTAVMLVVWNCRHIFSSGDRPRYFPLSKRVVFSGIVLLGIVFSIVTAMPGSETKATGVFSLSSSAIARSGMENIIFPGKRFYNLFDIFPKNFGLREFVVPWLLVCGLMKIPLLAVAYGVGMILLGMFFDLVYYGHIRHQGVLLIYSIALYWIFLKERMNSISEQHLKRAGNLFHFVHLAGMGILTTIFIYHILLVGYDLRMDIKNDMSNCKAMGKIIASRPELRDAIVMSEPDYAMEALPYYADNLIYIPRERVFRKFNRLTCDNKTDLTVSDLLYEAENLQKKDNKPVLIAISHPEFSEKPFGIVRYLYKNVFSWNEQEKTEFLNKTGLISRLRGAINKDENFDLFLLKNL